MKFFLLLFLVYYRVECAKILGVFHVPSYSHYTLGVKLLKPLALKGHEITMLSPFKLDNPPKTWKEVVIDDYIEPRRDKSILYEMAYFSSFTKVVIMNRIGHHLEALSLQHSKVTEFLQSNETFDLVVLEKFYNEAHLGFAHHFKAPYILLSTVSSSRWINEIAGNPGSPAYVPDIFFDSSANMNFWERLHNTILYIFAETFRHLFMFPKSQQLLSKYFKGSPNLGNLYYNASLILINSHLSIKPAVPSVPNMINIGGFHVSPPNNLSKDLQEFLDNAKNGVIYFSLGSNVQIKDMPEERRNAILKVLSEVKQKVLWKWEEDSLPNIPSNIKISKWFPQQDVLAHRNVVLFISHGGMLSIIEAIHHGVPLLNIPIFAEQHTNAAEAEIGGYGINVPYREFTEEKFRSALKELLSNSSYRENAQRRSRILRDQPITPLEKAIFWTEYVIRHKGAPHLRSVTTNLKWYQYAFLDIIIFIALITLTFCVFVWKCLTYLVEKKSKATEKCVKTD